MNRLCLLALSCLLVACGQRGPLYLPEHAPAPVPRAVPADMLPAESGPDAKASTTDSAPAASSQDQ
ncbi:MAG: lipoprotein [Gammaproteobacteria bacterium]|nr:lipoprotein [Gammaproteobacteria bacterium]